MSEIPWDTLIGGIALILSIIGILYTHKSLHSPILLEARKKHTADLTDFFRELHDNFPRYVSSTEPETLFTLSTSEHHPDINFYNFPKVETNWKYNDLMQNHLPEECNSFPKKWNAYKITVNEYGVKRNQIYEKIKTDVLNEIDLKYKSTLKGDHEISKQFISLLYTQCVTWIKDEHLSYKERNFRQENNELHLGPYGLAKGTKDDLIQAKENFEKMMFDEAYLTKYRNDILKIIEMEKELEDMYNNIKNIIENLLRYPLLPGKKCEILKNI